MEECHRIGRLMLLGEKGEEVMADCSQMKEGDLFVCETCGLQLVVLKACSCIAGEEVSCTVPLQCCGKDMVKR